MIDAPGLALAGIGQHSKVEPGLVLMDKLDKPWLQSFLDRVVPSKFCSIVAATMQSVSVVAESRRVLKCVEWPRAKNAGFARSMMENQRNKTQGKPENARVC